MLGSTAASPLPLRGPLAFGLCLVAFLFAVEAKTAWFGPVSGLGSDVRAAKALPMTTPRVVDREMLARVPAHPDILFAAVLADPETQKATAHAGAASEITIDHLSLFLADYLSPSSFVRPPPAL